jgi:type VI secretion system secreted protein VgrG
LAPEALNSFRKQEAVVNDMSSYSQDKRQLTLITPLGKDAVLINGFKGREAISALTELELDMLSLPENPIQPALLIGKRVTLGISYNETGRRYFNGIVRSLELVSHDSTLDVSEMPVLVYRAVVVPSLWLLTLNTQTRVFQNLTVIEIVKGVLGSYYITPKNDTQATYQPLDYCTQYRETDYDFVTRLLEQHGIFFYFTHTENDHVMVLADNAGQLAPCPVKNTYNYMPEMKRQGEGFYDMYLHYFGVHSALVTGKHTLWEYRFTQFARPASSPASSMSKADVGDNNHEWYDYADGPSAWAKTDASDGKIEEFESQLQDVTRDRSDTRSVEITGESNASLLLSGFTFRMEKHPDPALNSKYLILSVEHSALQQPSFRSSEIGVDGPYRNIFTAQPGSLVYRPARTTPKPRVNGVVTGKVVVPAGEDSYVDKYGRVCVQFWWDRTRPPNQTDNTVLRVAQAWAGSGWGTYFWPRVNDEVLIDFIEGDPDAPIIVGSLYNGVNKPKYDPKSEYTRSGILTRSSKNGSAANANELRFEDLKGAEQIFVNAERDLDVHVEHDWHTVVDNEEHLRVTKNRYHRIGGESNIRVEKNQRLEVEGDQRSSVRGEQVESVGANRSLNVTGSQFSTTGMVHVIQSGEEVHIVGGTRVVIDGGVAGICLRSAESAIQIDATGITLQGAMRIGVAACLPGTPAPPSPALTSPIAPQWPGDDPRK